MTSTRTMTSEASIALATATLLVTGAVATAPPAGATTTVSSDTVALASGCASGTMFFRLTLGSGAAFTTSADSPLHVGQDLTNPTLTITADGAVCGEFQTSGAGIPAGCDGTITVDQSAAALSTMALQAAAPTRRTASAAPSR